MGVGYLVVFRIALSNYLITPAMVPKVNKTAKTGVLTTAKPQPYM